MNMRDVFNFEYVVRLLFFIIIIKYYTLSYRQTVFNATTDQKEKKNDQIILRNHW